MSRILQTVALLFASILFASGQEPTIKIGAIRFFGYGSKNIEKIKSDLGFREGDEVTHSSAQLLFEHAKKNLKEKDGLIPTGFFPICCDSTSGLIVYVGLSGESKTPSKLPTGKISLPPLAGTLYDNSMAEVENATRNGKSTEEWSHGYALSDSWPPLRDAQLSMRDFALANTPLLIQVLRESASSRQRGIAAELLGYSEQSGAQVSALAAASLDADEAVRNNATRALGVIINFKPELAANLDVDPFVHMLLSGTWTDVNKASLVLMSVSFSREPKVLSRLRERRIVERLIEMARWKTTHSNTAIQILGRLAGFGEDRIARIIASCDPEPLIAALSKTAG